MEVGAHCATTHSLRQKEGETGTLGVANKVTSSEVFSEDPALSLFMLFSLEQLHLTSPPSDYITFFLSTAILALQVMWGVFLRFYVTGPHSLACTKYKSNVQNKLKYSFFEFSGHFDDIFLGVV